MKFRTDFVTNSSSSSFIIAKKNLNEEQILAIQAHIKLAQKLNFDDCDEYDEWSIQQNDEYISGNTWMDNFDMFGFLKLIGVDMKNIEWGEFPFNVNNYKPKESNQEDLDPEDENFD